MSAAIPIVAPTSNSALPAQGTSSRPPVKKDQPQRKPQCRNELIYGSCKYADSGCPFYHPSKDASPAPSAPPGLSGGPAIQAGEGLLQPPNIREEPKPATPSTVLGGTLSAQHVNAPIFVPKGLSPMVSAQSGAASSGAGSQAPSTEYEYQDDMMDHFDFLTMDDAPYPAPNGQAGLPPPFIPAQDMDMETYSQGNPYYDGPSSYMRQPLQYHLYNPPLPYVSSLPPHANPFMADDVRETLQQRSEAILAGSSIDFKLPDLLHVYHSLVPIEHPAETRHPRVFQWPSTCYRAMSTKDGRPYLLRRFEGFRLVHEAALASVSIWNQIKHPNIVSLHEAFTTREFGDSSLVFAFDFHPLSETLYSAHLRPKPPAPKNGRMQQPQVVNIPEATLWSYVVQLGNAMRVAHAHNLAMRTFEATKILVTGKNRIRVNCCGVFDVINYNPAQNMVHIQQNDYSNLGKLLLELSCNSTAAATNYPKSVDIIQKRYSADFTKLVLYLITPAGPPKNLDKMFEFIGKGRLLDEMDAMTNYADSLEGQLMSELENGRLVRIMAKLGFINERPEFDHDPRWSETGDRYIIKLFRDYVFHQVDMHGNPVVNLSHVLTCLNKLDAGVDERVMLVSRDEQSCLVVSYKDIKAVIETAFSDLSRASVR